MDAVGRRKGRRSHEWTGRHWALCCLAQIMEGGEGVTVAPNRWELEDRHLLTGEGSVQAADLRSL